MQRARAHGDDLGEHGSGEQDEVEPQAPPQRRRGDGQLASLARDLASERALPRDEQGQPGHEQAAAGCCERRAREVGGRRLQQGVRTEDRKHREEACGGADERAGTGERERAIGEHPQQLTPLRSAQAQIGLLSPLRRGQHPSRVGGQRRRQQDCGQAEEEEHALADGGVGARHAERVRDVVDEVVLPGGDPIDRTRDGPRLRQRLRRIGAQPSPLDAHVHLLDRPAPDHPAERRALRAQRRHDRAGEHGRADDDRLWHVEEVLESARAAAGKERPRARQVGHAADRQRDAAARGEAQRDGLARLDGESASGLGAEQGGRRPERSARDADRGVVVAIAAIEREQPNPSAHGHAARPERPGGQVDEGQPVGGCHAGNRRDPRAHLREREAARAVGRDRLEALAARDAGSQPYLPRAHAARDPRPVGDRDRRSRGDRSDVASQAGNALRERTPAPRAGQPRAVQRRRAGEIAERRGRLFLDDDVVRGLGPAVDHAQRDRDRLSGLERARGAEALLQAQAAAERRAEHALHVERERGDCSRCQRRARAVDEEEHAGEQADAEHGAGHGRECPARVAHELTPDVATHARSARPRVVRRAASAAGRAVRPARGRA